MFLAIALLVIASSVGAALGFYLGSLLGYSFTGGFCGAVLAFCAYLAYEIEITDQKKAKVLQLFGKFSRCLNHDGKSAGLYLVARPFEKIFNEVPVLQDFPVELFRDILERSKIQFKDTFSYLRGTAWVRIFDPVKFTYELSNPVSFIEGLLDSEVRPQFGGKTFDEGNADKGEISTNSEPIIDEILKNYGCDLSRLFLEDFVLPPEVDKIRQELLQGETDGKRLKAKMDGVVLSIATIADGLIAKGMTQDKAVEKAANIFFEQTGMETVREAKANFTFIAQEVKGMLRVFAPSGSQQGGK